MQISVNVVRCRIMAVPNADDVPGKMSRAFAQPGDSAGRR